MWTYTSILIIDRTAFAPYNQPMNRPIPNSKTGGPVSDEPIPFIGLDTAYPTVSGERVQRLHLDGAASPLAAQRALTTIEKVLPHYSNTHSYVHSSAQISTKALAWAHETVLKYVGASADRYATVFTGSGTTAAINRIARGLSAARPDRKTVLVSAMEHHANDLPHRQFDNDVTYIPTLGEGANAGALDLEFLAKFCQEHSDTVNYVAVSSVSNVTGVRNNIKEICRIAHQYSILVLVDGAQSVAHGETHLDQLDADFLVFSGHKIYTPMAPGVMVAKRALLQQLEGQDLGGGSVSTVSPYDYEFVENESDKEESGTPNIVGAIALAAVLNQLMEYGLERVEAHDQAISEYAQVKLTDNNQLTVYADSSLARTGALAFNHSQLDHGLLAAILNDYFAIAVRNECFCAHPYVSSLLKDELWELDLSDVDEAEQESFINRKRGMVRVSFSLYNTKADIDRLALAINSIEKKPDHYSKNYTPQPDGSYIHNEFSLDWQTELGLGR